MQPPCHLPSPEADEIPAALPGNQGRPGRQVLARMPLAAPLYWPIRRRPGHKKMTDAAAPG